VSIGWSGVGSRNQNPSGSHYLSMRVPKIAEI
jgi:hypothetical protein